MPTLTEVEHTLLKRLERKADSLKNVAKGDIEVLSEVVADIAHVLVARARMGSVSPQECLSNRTEQDGTWKTALAVTIPVCGTVAAIALPVILKLAG